MIFARITGSVVSTIHHPIVDGRKLLLAERLQWRPPDTGRRQRTCAFNRRRYCRRNRTRVELTAELRICTQQILNSKTGTGTFSYKFYKTFAPGIHARSDPKIHLRRPQRL